MSNFLTDGRTALLQALQGDAQIAARVRTWFEFGAGLRRRYNLEPSACPLVALAPAESEAVRAANAFTDIAQRLRIEAATAGHDAEPCEELVALILDRLAACDQGCMGLAAEGLAGVEVEGIRWRAVPEPSGARIVWAAVLTVALCWKRV